MLLQSMNRFVSTLAIIFLISANIAIAQNSTSTILKADRIDGDKQSNIINATGNVEVRNGQDILFSDELIYDKDNKIIKATGNVEVKGERGSIFANYADIKDDFTTGNLTQGEIIFDDGSYVTSPTIKRKSKSKTILQRSIFSFCPNPEITSNRHNVKDDKGLISMKSRSTTIDKEDSSAKIRSGVLRVKNFPIFYTPYLRFPLRSSKGKSGFLNPSYINTDNLGFGVSIPYYFNIAPNKDLTTTTQYHPAEKHIILNNNFRHLTKKGKYNVELEAANNNLTATEDNSTRRWHLLSNGYFELTDNSQIEFNMNHVSDKNYLRDYHNDFFGHTVSEVNLDHIKNKNYNSIKAVSIQELENNVDSREEVNAIPVINSYIESKPGKLDETYSLLTNATIINRRSGLQYRRLSLVPEFEIPYNLSGNIFKLSSSVQGDFYNLDDNYTSTPKTTEYDHTEFDYRPQVSLSWNLPLIKKMEKSSFVIEPKVNFISSSYSKNYNHIPNEDSNDTELTQGNLFLKDRFVGFDRNESGQRVNYGFTSNLFNSLGQFGFGLGQGYRENNKVQDVAINGFTNNKSNIVGEISYKSPEIFQITYNFQLNESNYTNDVNEVISRLGTNNYSIYSNYILIRGNDFYDTEEREQISVGAKAKIYGNLKGRFRATKDLVTNRIIGKRMGIDYDGCCVIYGISVSESNPSNLKEPEKSYNINFSIKNL